MEDYIKVHRGSDKYSKDIRDRVAGTNAVVSENPKIPGLERLVIIRNMNSTSYTEEQILTHEERHVLNSMLGNVFFERLPERKSVYKELRQYLESQKSSAVYDASYEKTVRGYLRLIRKFSEVRLKDELIAYVADGDEYGWDKLAVKAEERGVYDFCLKDIERLKSVFATVLAGDLSWEFNEIDRVFVKECQRLLGTAWAVGRILRELGYSNGEAAAFLAKIPLAQWRKNVKRLVGPTNYKKHLEEVARKAEKSGL